MLLFVILGAITVAALVFLVPPLLRRPRENAPRAAFDLEIYRDQLAELERDVARGVITAEEATTARIEIERRVLAAAAPEASEPPAAPATASIAVAFSVVAALPLIAGSLYLWLGSPGLESEPFAARAPEGGADDRQVAVDDIESMVARLAERLRSEPDDLEGWMMLARSYRVLERYDEAIGALRHAARLTGDDPGVVALIGEYHVMAAGGIVTPQAIGFFESALAADPNQAVPRFYLGLARAQAGDLRGALDDWVALARESPAGAPYMASLKERIDAVAGELGVDVAELLPEDEGGAAAPGPTREDIASAQSMPDDDRMEMIRGMVARLAQRLEDDPDDLDGWLRLGRSHGVLGDAERARDAYARAATLAPDDARVLEAYAVAIVDAAPGSARLPGAAALVARRLVDIDGANAAGLWLLGRAEAEDGNADAARALWGRLLAQLPPDGPDHDAVKGAIEALGAE